MAPPKLLIVDGNRHTWTMLELALGYGADRCQVFSAPSGHSALLQLGVLQPDLILLALAAPGGEGWDTLRRIRAVSRVPILALAAEDTPEIALRSLEQGAAYCLRQPLALQELRARVRALLPREGENLGWRPRPVWALSYDRFVEGK
jgi:two-component system response regulator MprA